jgi:hypothetical protein
MTLAETLASLFPIAGFLLGQHLARQEAAQTAARPSPHPTPTTPAVKRALLPPRAANIWKESVNVPTTVADVVEKLRAENCSIRAEFSAKICANLTGPASTAWTDEHDIELLLVMVKEDDETVALLKGAGFAAVEGQPLQWTWKAPPRRPALRVVSNTESTGKTSS